LPTYSWLARFGKDFDDLTPAQQAPFLLAVGQFGGDLNSGRGFHKGLRVKAIKGAAGIVEMTWADDGWATATRSGKAALMSSGAESGLTQSSTSLELEGTDDSPGHDHGVPEDLQEPP